VGRAHREALVALETIPGMRWFPARSWIVVAAGSITDVNTRRRHAAPSIRSGRRDACHPRG